MKKLKILTLLLITLYPLKIMALDVDYEIRDYVAEYNILENGNVEVTEMFTQKGTFNGYLLTLDISNNISEPIYDITSISDISVLVNGNFPQIYNNDDSSFMGEENLAAIYEEGSVTNIKIYNKTVSGTVQYKISYTLNDVIVNHNDISEFYYNFFTKGMKDNIKNVKIIVNIPKQANNFRAFGHGDLTGNVELVNNQSVIYTIGKHIAATYFDGRILFDNGIVNATKKSQETKLDEILVIEQARADEANKLREEARQKIKILTIWSYITWAIVVILGFVGYFVFDKEHKRLSFFEYYREIPVDAKPAKVEYLLHHKLTSKSLIASILELVERKIIKITKIAKKKDDFILTCLVDRTLENNGINESDEALLQLLFEEETEILLSNFKKKSKKIESAFDIRGNYDTWKTLQEKEFTTYDYYENNSKKVGPLAVFIMMNSFTIFVFTMIYEYYHISNIVAIVSSICLFIYLLRIKKRTRLGNEEYYKWLGIKKFLSDFGRMYEKETIELSLWPKYLVYATVLGISNKVLKEMKDVASAYELDLNNQNFGNFFNNFIYYQNFSTSFDKCLGLSASTVRVASSNSSSSSGFGGGFSSGSGFGGGGRGGGGF